MEAPHRHSHSTSSSWLRKKSRWEEYRNLVACSIGATSVCPQYPQTSIIHQAIEAHTHAHHAITLQAWMNKELNIRDSPDLPSDSISVQMCATVSMGFANRASLLSLKYSVACLLNILCTQLPSSSHTTTHSLSLSHTCFSHRDGATLAPPAMPLTQVTTQQHSTAACPCLCPSSPQRQSQWICCTSTTRVLPLLLMRVLT